MEREHMDLRDEVSGARSGLLPSLVARIRLAPVVLAGYLAGLLAGGILRLVGEPQAADALWAAVGGAGAVYSLLATLSVLKHKRLGVDVIALLALLGALLTEEYLAAAVISVMLATGRALEGWAAGRARRDLRALMERSPKWAHRYTSGVVETVPVDAVRPGDRLVVATGEVVPADGDLLADAVLDESALSGEPLPVVRNGGDPVRSGSINGGSPFDLLVTAEPAESTYAGIVRLVRDAENSQAPMVRLADRYALWFVALSLAAAGGAWGLGGPGRAVAVLVVATPCPLILAAPVALVSGLSRAARRGVVIKTGEALERLAGCRTLVIDKTGTVTKGHPHLTAVVPAPWAATEDVLALAASLEQASSHVLASAVVQAAHAQHRPLTAPGQVEEVSGQGVRGSVGSRRVALGNAEWVGVKGDPLWARAARRDARLHGLSTVYVSVDGRVAGMLVFEDPVRADAARTVRSLRRAGIERIVMLSGDRADVVETVGAMVGVDEAVGSCTPSSKLEAVRRERDLAPTVMVGDGINDAPALAIADVGVAIGARGATVSSEAADVVLVVDNLERIRDAKAIAHRARRTAVQSAGLGMGMSLAAMVPAAMGLLPALWGALLQEVIDVAAILNALRALRRPRGELRLSPEDLAVANRFSAEHELIRAEAERLRRAADALGTEAVPDAMALVQSAYRSLVDNVQPHEQAEEEFLYPAVDRILGGIDGTGTMSRGHAEIALQIKRLGRMLADIGAGTLDDADVNELRRLLYGLYAVILLHTAQEEENYLSLADIQPSLPGPASARAGGRLPGASATTGA